MVDLSMYIFHVKGAWIVLWQEAGHILSLLYCSNCSSGSVLSQRDSGYNGHGQCWKENELLCVSAHVHLQQCPLSVSDWVRLMTIMSVYSSVHSCAHWRYCVFVHYLICDYAPECLCIMCTFVPLELCLYITPLCECMGVCSLSWA